MHSWYSQRFIAPNHLRKPAELVSVNRKLTHHAAAPRWLETFAQVEGDCCFDGIDAEPEASCLP